MRKPMALAAGWLVVAVMAVAVAWQGVSIVGDQVTDDRPAALSAAEIEDRLAGTGRRSGATTTAGPSVGDGAAPVSAPAAPTSPSAPASTTAPIAPAPTTPAPVAPTPSTSSPSTSPPATSPPPSVAAPAPAPPIGAAPAETRTYRLVGGTAALRYGPQGVSVVFANPAPGFSVETGASGDGGVRVEFESDGHRSRLEGRWEGLPVEQVREEPDG